MIGQKDNISKIVKWRMNKSFPRFILIEGDYGSGRLTLSKEIIKVLNATGVISENSINAVRTVISNAYNVTEPTVYIFRDCDDMSLAAKNSMLKVVEEPPNNAYFIMTVQSLSSVLDTIKSRATVLKMNRYTQNELNLAQFDDKVQKYIYTVYDTTKEQIEAINDAVELCNDVFIALQNKSCSGVLKETTRLKAKSTDIDKVDPLLFMRVFRNNITELGITEPRIGSEIVRYITECDMCLSRNSVSKKNAIETMLVNIIALLKE